MDRDTQLHYRARLERTASELRRRLASDQEARDPVSPDRAIGRLTRIDALQAQQVSLEMHRRAQQRLQRVEHALTLIAEGRYGTCTKCGEDIERTRLDAAPDTFLCVSCLAQLQRR
jgi:DnaK suppressor protein